MAEDPSDEDSDEDEDGEDEEMVSGHNQYRLNGSRWKTSAMKWIIQW